MLCNQADGCGCCTVEPAAGADFLYRQQELLERRCNTAQKQVHASLPCLAVTTPLASPGVALTAWLCLVTAPCKKLLSSIQLLYCCSSLQCFPTLWLQSTLSAEQQLRELTGRPAISRLAASLHRSIQDLEVSTLLPAVCRMQC